jgi:SulP family sulfate permease
VSTKHGKQHLKDVVLDKNNWIAGVTVALVSVPLSIALGIASGTTPMRGVATAVFGGACAGLFGSSDYNIVGPAGALSGMLMSYCLKWGDDVLPWLSLISAVICLICALLRLDKFMLLMPKSVFEGFTVGVALIIGLNQINFACGLIPGKKHALFIMNIVESIKTLGETKPASLIIFLLQTPLLWLLMRKVPKIPWTVILPVVSVPIGLLCDSGTVDIELLTLKSKYGILAPELVQSLKTTEATFVDMLIPAFSIAIVAVLETLISAKIAAGRVDRSFNELKEMRGLVIAHAVCGAVGGMPPTGVFVRTSLNTSLGATHRFAQFLNAIVVAIISLALMPLFSYLPQATIAAILVVASIRMTPISYLKKLWAEDKGALALCLVTALICVGEDPVIGLAVGMVIALLAAAKKMLEAPFVDIKHKPVGTKRAYTVAVQGALTYVNAEMFIEKARKLEDAHEVSMDLSGVRQLDHDGVCALSKVADVWKNSEPDCLVYVKGVSATVYPFLSKFEWFTTAEDQGRVQKA